MTKSKRERMKLKDHEEIKQTLKELPFLVVFDLIMIFLLPNVTIDTPTANYVQSFNFNILPLPWTIFVLATTIFSFIFAIFFFKDHTNENSQ